MSAAPSKTLKQEGVPFGARMVYRLQYAGLMVACVGLLLSMPFVFIWGLLHPSAEDFVEGVEDVLLERLEQAKAHRARVVAMYAATGASQHE